VSYDGCPFELLCPLGKGIEPDCDTQRSAVLGSMGSIIGCCILCLARWIQVKLRPKYEGQQFVKELGIRTKYKIKRPQGRMPGASGDKDDDLDGSRSKVHVIWDIDAAQLESFLRRRPSLSPSESDPHAGAGTGLGDVIGDGSGPPGPPRVSRSESRFEIGPASSSDAAHSFTVDVMDDEHPEEVRVSAGVDTRPGHEVFESFFAYRDKARVEYYSLSYRRWIGGSVQVEMKANKRGLPPTIFYHVRINRGQIRHHVELELLRPPFERGELVELFSRRGGGTWLAATINGPQDSGATTLGYKVRLNSDGQIYEEIPAIRLRRRFPRGLPIEVYRGFETGWVATTVHHTSTEDGCGLESLDHKEIHHAMESRTSVHQVDHGIGLPDEDAELPALAAVAPRESYHDDDAQLAGIVPIPDSHQVPELNIDIWTRVPVCTDDEGEFYEVVDSYLIRQRFDERAHERQENRRQVAL